MTIGLIFLAAMGAIALASIAVALLAGRRAPDATPDERNSVHRTGGSPVWMRPDRGGF